MKSKVSSFLMMLSVFSIGPPIACRTTAIQKAPWDMVDLLLENGADIKAKESQAVTYAAVYENFDLVERLVNLGMNVLAFLNKEVHGFN